MRLALADTGSHMDAPLWMVLLVCTVVLVAFRYVRHLRRPPHRHEWEYQSKSLTGWGVVHCKTCDKWDIW